MYEQIKRERVHMQLIIKLIKRGGDTDVQSDERMKKHNGTINFGQFHYLHTTCTCAGWSPGSLANPRGSECVIRRQ